MELQELKNIWNNSDQQSDNFIKINIEDMKKISIEKTHSSLYHLKVGAVLELVINWMVLMPVLRFGINHIAEPKFAIPAIFLALVIAANMVWNIYTFILLQTISYNSPIVAIQKKLEAFNLRNMFRQGKLLYMLYPFIQTTFIIVVVRGVAGLDLYNYSKFLIIQFLVALAIIPFMILVVKLLPDKRMKAAIDFLKDIKKFEAE